MNFRMPGWPLLIPQNSYSEAWPVQILRCGTAAANLMALHAGIVPAMTCSA